ncbi:M15 family metallopeptidase [Nocardioides sp. CPCC 205120]|uniref:M15 family metallopeptidase n=1 Tax=Nocardioides sp. CPCC 205120 TaxID=3406462 RepID=UPI003B50157F
MIDTRGRRARTGAALLVLVAGGGAVAVGQAVDRDMTAPVIDRLTQAPRTFVGSDPGGDGGADGEFQGSVPVDADIPALTRLDPELRTALRAAATAAATDGIEVRVTSGWRSRDYQQRLLDRAVERYGSPAEASRWVAGPDASAHVTGDAVDVGPTDAAYWMTEHGADFGLCQVFGNEIWHYELRDVVDGECPPMREDNAS